MQEEEDRLLVLPVVYTRIWFWYKTIEGLMWPAQDSVAALADDRGHWNNVLTAGDRGYYTPIFAMLGPADEYITRNIDERFVKEFKPKEFQYLYTALRQHEQSHSESYSLQIMTIFEGDALARVMEAGKNMPAVGAIYEWVDQWICSDAPLAHRLVAFAFFEGGMFQGLFMSIQQLKERNVMPGVTMLNELISRDEGTHCSVAADVKREFTDPRSLPSQELVNTLMTEAVRLMDDFFQFCCDEARKAEGLPDDAPCPVRGITEDKMRRYVRSVFDAVAQDLDYTPLFGVKNPYPESVKLSLNRVAKTNFFEHRPSQYNNNYDVNVRFDPADVSAAVPGAAARDLGALLKTAAFRSRRKA